MSGQLPAYTSGEPQDTSNSAARCKRRCSGRSTSPEVPVAPVRMLGAGSHRCPTVPADRRGRPVDIRGILGRSFQ